MDGGVNLSLPCFRGHPGCARRIPGFDKWHPRSGDLFFRNAHLRRFRLRFDDGTVLARHVEHGSRSHVVAGLQEWTRRVRLEVDEVWPEPPPLPWTPELREEDRSPCVAPLTPALRQELKQIILDLLINAVKFTPRGTVEVSAAHLEATDQISFTVDGHRLLDRAPSGLRLTMRAAVLVVRAHGGSVVRAIDPDPAVRVSLALCGLTHRGGSVGRHGFGRCHLGPMVSQKSQASRR